MPTANDLLNKLPDKEKAKIANTLLVDVRQRFGSERLGLVDCGCQDAEFALNNTFLIESDS